MTNEELELGLRAATTFKDLFPEAWKHDSKPRPNKCCGLYCTKCKVEFTRENGELDKLCTVQNPIDINWNVAMMVFRSLDACQRTNAHSKLAQIFLQEIDDDRGAPDELAAANNPTELMLSTDTWFWNFGEPKHLILAACIAKERG